MPLSFVASDALGQSSIPLQLTWPATDADDLALLFLSRSNVDTNILPTGFTVDPGHPYDANSGSHRIYLYYKICTGSESGAFSVGNPTGGAAARQAAILYVFRGVDTADPYTFTRFDATVSGLTHDAPSITIPVADCGIMTMITNRDSGTSGGNNAATAPTGFTSNQDSTGIGGVGSGGSFIGAATDTIPTSRAASTVVDPGVWTFTDSGNPATGSPLSTANAVVYTIAINPEAAAPPEDPVFRPGVFIFGG